MMNYGRGRDQAWRGPRFAGRLRMSLATEADRQQRQLTLLRRYKEDLETELRAVEARIQAVESGQAPAPPQPPAQPQPPPPGPGRWPRQRRRPAWGDYA